MPAPKPRLEVLLLAATALAPLPLAAQTHDRSAPGDYHNPPSEEIVVTAPYQRDRASALSGVSVLTGTALTRDIRPSLGETLGRQAGVSATSFGPNASRPVLRGFQGDRVRVLTDGIGSFDVSSTSVDHAVVINPLTAERIEVLRGPSALLFGSSAIGGVVNVLDKRIPRRVPDEPVHIDALATYGSAARERSVGAAADAAIGSQLVLHIDGSYSKTGNLRTGGAILAPAERAEAAASDDPEIAGLANLRGRLPNSAARTWDVAGGAALITEGGNLGLSVSRYDSLYGVPIRYALEPGEEAEAVRLAVKQTRADMRAEVDAGGALIDTIRFRAGYADYQHQELEEDGAVGTTFYNDSYEARLELAQAARGGWKGAVGGQMMIRNFRVVGEEKFLPVNETQQYGLFTLQEFDLGVAKVEAGGRYEHSKLRAEADADLNNPDYRRSFDALSGSLGASLMVADGWRIGLNGSRAERAPSAEELFARGNHAGTQAYELGNPGFTTEKSWGIEATLRGRGDGYSFNTSAYHSWFKDYIYESRQPQTVCEAAESIEVEFPCFAYYQADARYWGFEIEGSKRLLMLRDWSIVADALTDYVRATVVGDGPAPRIPAWRVLAGVEAQSDRVQARAEVEWVDHQKRITSFETPTDGYTMVNASVSFQPFRDNPHTSIVLSANNIFDVTARRHASFLKDFAPLAGRDIRISGRVSF